MTRHRGWPYAGVRTPEWDAPRGGDSVAHVGAMMELSCECPVCTAWLDTVLRDPRRSLGDRPQPKRHRRRR